MAPAVNPWAPETWDPVAQANYIRKNGMARAIARANDAHTTVHGAPPIPKYDHKKHVKAVRGIVQRRNALRNQQHHVLSITDVSMALGYTEVPNANLLDTEVDIILSPGDITFGAAFRLGAAVADIPFGNIRLLNPSFAMGVATVASPVAQFPAVAFTVGTDLAEALDLTKLITTSASLGITETAVTGNERQLVASMALGADVGSGLAINVQPITASMSLGLADASALLLERDIVASAALGLTDSSAVQLERDLAEAFALGVDAASAVEIAERDLVLSFDLGVDELSVLGSERLVAASMAVGIAEAAQADVLFNLISTHSLGVDEAAAVGREFDIVASHDLGVTLTERLDASVPLVNMGLGIDEAAAVQLEANLASLHSLGITEAAAVNLESDIVSSMGLGAGVTLPAYGLDLQRNAANDMHLGFDMAITPTLPFNMPAISIALGIAEAEAMNNEQYIAASMGLGVTQAPSTIPTINPLLLEAGRAHNPVINSSTFAASNSVSYTGVDFGTPNARRWIVCLVVHGNSSRTVSSVTIGGVPAAIIDVVPQIGDTIGTRRASVWGVNLAAGTSGNIDIIFSGTETQCTLASYIIDGDVAPGAFDEFALNANVTGFASQSMNVKAGGLTIATMHSNNGSVAWGTGTPAMNSDNPSGVQIRSLDGSNYAADGTQTTGAITSAGAVSEFPMEFGISLYPDPIPPLKLTVPMALGISEAAAASTTLETVFSASAALGISEAQTFSFEKDITLNAALGISEAPGLIVEKDLTVAAALGISEAATVTTSAPAGPLTVTFQSQKGTTSTTATLPTFTAMAAGTASADRWVIVAVHGFGSNKTINTVNCNGVGMTPVVQLGSGVLQPIGLFAQLVTTGTTVDIDVTFSGSEPSGAAIAVFTITGNTTITVQATGSQASANPCTASIATVNNGVMIAVAGRNGSTAGSWNADVTQTYNSVTTPAQLRLGGIAQTTGTTLNPAASFSSATVNNMVAASWRSGP